MATDYHNDEQNASVQTTGKKKRDIVVQVRSRLQDSYEADRENRRQAALDLSFLAGDQWDTATSEARRNARRPMLTINRLPAFIGQVVNDIRQSDLEIKAVAVEDTDKEITETYNGLLRQIQQKSSAKSVYASTVASQVACGMGYFRITTDYIDDASFDQEIKIEAIPNPLSVYFDPAAVKPDRSDAMWCIVTEEIPRKAFEAKYKKFSSHEVPVPTDFVRDNLHWFSEDTVRIAEYWVKKEVKLKIAQTPEGETIDVTDLPKEAYSNLPVREVVSHEVEMWLCSGGDVLEGPHKWAGKHIPIIPAFGQEVPLEHFTYRYGLIRFARDAQQLYNYYRTAAAEWVNLAPKSPFMVTKKQIGEYKRLWDDQHLSPRPYLVYEHDPEVPQGPQRQPAPELPSALMAEAQVAVDDLKATTGIFDASLGNQSNERSGKAILARQKEGDTANFHYIDNFERSLEYAGRQLIDLIPKIYDNDRVLRLFGPNDEENVVPINRVIYGMDGVPQVVNDLSVGRFDVRVKIGPSYTTKRLETAEQLMEFIQAYPPAAELIADLIAKNLDFPGADEMARRLMAVVPPEVRDFDPEGPPPEPPEPPPEVQMQQMQMESQAELQEMKIAEADRKSQAEQQKLAMEMQFKQREHQMKMAELAAEQELERLRIQMEIKRMALQGGLDQQKAQLDSQKVEQAADLAEKKAKQAETNVRQSNGNGSSSS